MYERPRLERFGTFRELTQLSPGVGSINLDVVNGGAAACDCLPVEQPPGRS
ncbi:MAG: lasso RiPP family leader peptide-containing protein [Gemmatimonadaceae bacterium]|jgi:hypothetical protein|nr:lasso RiPP family leader peptide-containing protein [Gemmatimonadaceae bacterium]